MVTLWGDPKEDKGFMTAVRQNRVMTVHQENVGAAKDFGVVGFSPGKNVAYLVFGRPLDAFEERRIIGIKYDLIESPRLKGRLVRQSEQPRTKRRGGVGKGRRVFEVPHESRRKSAEKKFEVTVRFSAYTELTQVIAAKTKGGANEAALKNLRTPDFSSAAITRKVVRTKMIE